LDYEAEKWVSANQTAMDGKATLSTREEGERSEGERRKDSANS